MTAAAARRGARGRLFSGPRAGTTIMAAGLALAVLAALLVFVVARRARTQVADGGPVAQVYAVMATREVAAGTAIPADAVTVKPFPAAFAPEGVVSTVDQVVGRYATTRLTRDQLVLSSQVSSARPGANLAETIPPGKVGLWVTLPDLIVQAGGLRAGDRVDILLSLALPAGTEGGSGLTTQVTLQNVEIFFVGATTPQAPPAEGAAPAPPRMALLLVEPQDAVTAKFIKDSGGTIDFVLRSRQWADAASPEAVNLQTLLDRFGFRRR
jgi:pilus assembly protein CpaB